MRNPEWALREGRCTVGGKVVGGRSWVQMKNAKYGGVLSGAELRLASIEEVHVICKQCRQPCYFLGDRTIEQN